MKFKSPRQESDWEQLKTNNHDLYAMVQNLAMFCDMKYGLPIVITDIFRTKDEFDALYLATDPAKRPATSPHCRWEAVDLRSTTFTPEQIQVLINYWNSIGGKALYHAIKGNAAHLHFAYARTKTS